MQPLRYCRERLLVPGSAHSLAQLFAPPGEAERLLAVHAVLDHLLEIPASVSDPEIGQRKLGWWRDELAAAYGGGGDHPAGRALSDTGATERVARERFEELIAALVDACRAGPPGDMAELWRRSAALGGAAAVVEAGVAAPGSDPDPLRDLGAAGWLVRVVGDLRATANTQSWPVPLSLRARWKVERTAVDTGMEPAGWPGMVRDMLEPGRQVLDNRRSALSGGEARRHRRRLVQAELDWRLLRAISRRPRRVLGGRYRPGVLGDLWAARRAARRALLAGRDGAG